MEHMARKDDRPDRIDGQERNQQYYGQDPEDLGYDAQAMELVV